MEDFTLLRWHSGTHKKTSREGETKGPNQDFSGEALSKQNIKAWLTSLSCDLSRAPTEWSAIFAFGVFLGLWHFAIGPMLKSTATHISLTVLSPRNIHGSSDWFNRREPFWSLKLAPFKKKKSFVRHVLNKQNVGLFWEQLLNAGSLRATCFTCVKIFWSITQVGVKIFWSITQ